MNTETKTFPLILTIPFHRKIKETAKEQHTSINKFIMSAIKEKLDKEE